MPERDSSVAPPFDHGVFLLHYNRGREAFQEGRYAEARRELEQAQKMRPDDPDVLNLLGLVYFKTNAYPEAEVIYRRLVKDNKTIFTLHSNLGLILFKQGKLEEAEGVLLRAIELRPNYAKSHLYLGLLYRQRKKFGLALEHLRFAGAEKLVREIEADMRPPEPSAEAAADHIATAKTLVRPRPRTEQSVALPPPEPPPRHPREDHVITQKIPAVKTNPVSAKTARDAELYVNTERGTTETPIETEPQQMVVPSAPTMVMANTPTMAVGPPPGAIHAASKKLQEAVDDPQHVVDDRTIDLERRIEGASKTFVLHENGFLEINFARSAYVKKGTVSSYSGNLKFVAETSLLGTTAQTLVKAVGQGKIFIYEKGRKTFLLDLNEEFIYVEGSHLLALEDTLTYRVEPIYDAAYQRKIDTVKIFGKGSLAISTSIEPLTLRVSEEYPLSISSGALVAWTGNLIPNVMDDQSLENIMIGSDNQSGFKIRFEGDGVVVSEQ